MATLRSNSRKTRDAHFGQDAVVAEAEEWIGKLGNLSQNQASKALRDAFAGQVILCSWENRNIDRVAQRVCPNPLNDTYVGPGFQNC